MASARPTWQVSVATLVVGATLVGAVWGVFDTFITKVDAKERIAMETKARESDVSALTRAIKKVVTTLERVDDNQILIGERLRVRNLSKRGE